MKVIGPWDSKATAGQWQGNGLRDLNLSSCMPEPIFMTWYDLDDIDTVDMMNWNGQYRRLWYKKPTVCTDTEISTRGCVVPRDDKRENRWW